MNSRYSSSKKKRITIKQPNLIQKYNMGMGGVDILDGLLSSYRPILRSKKWWWNLFSNALNMAVIAAWLVHKEMFGKKAISHLEFRREVTMRLLQISPRKFGPKTGPKIHVPAIRRKSDGHFLVKCTQGRCWECKANARLECRECQKRLHLECFPKYHGF